MKRIVLILPYFGKFNNYFQLWLNSCRANPSIDWFIYTDSDQDYDWPNNCKKIYCTFEEFRERIQSLFDFEILLDRPYKLCDFKVTYGDALYDDIKDYDFWGYCDCDLIFGDIRSFVDLETALEKHDKLFTRGHFSLYKLHTTRGIYKTFSEDYKKVFSSPESFAFDEWSGISQQWDASGKDYYDELLYDDIITFFSNFHPTKKLSGYGSPYHRKNYDESVKYREMNGIIYYYHQDKGLYRYWIDAKKKIVKSEPVMYVHLQKRQMEVTIPLNSREYIIVPNKFVEYHEIDVDFIKSENTRITLNDCISIGKLLVHNIIGK